MKKLFAIILTLLVLSPAAAWAGTPTVEAGLTPESRFYWFDRMAEKIQLVLTLDGKDKAGVLSKISLERLAEAENVGNTETIGGLVSDYLRNQEDAAALAGDNVETLVGLTEDQITSFEQLQGLSDGASDDIKDKIEKASTQAARLLEKQSAKLEKFAGRTSGKAADKSAKFIEKTTTRLNRLVGKATRVGQTKNATETIETTEAPKNDFATVEERVRAMRIKHIEVLQGVIKKAPDAAKSTLQRILDRQSAEASETPEASINSGNRSKGKGHGKGLLRRNR